MPCRPLPDGGFVCSRGERQRPCECGRPAVALCDQVVGRVRFGEPVRTCDRPLCRDHRMNVGPNEDYCIEHGLARLESR